MITEAQLPIRLTPGAISPNWKRGCVNTVCGGPETLLHWLETKLGLPVPPIHIASRITEFAAALDTLPDASFGNSLKNDRWETASDLLSRRDELLLAAWDETESGSLPAVVNDLARAVQGRTFAFPGIATRLRRVLDALDTGQVLPSHRCLLYDAPDRWPVLWQKVLSKLTLDEPPASESLAPADSGLHVAQAVVRGAEPREIEQDSTFRYIHTRSQSSAVEFIATVLAASPDTLAKTVICCEDDELAMRLDACLSRLGLPTTGASAWSKAHPVLQLLPLTLALCWEPVDPQALLDFLTLPVMPLPRRAAYKLATALSEEPGLGSSRWNETLEALCDAENDPDGKLRERLDAWLECDRARRSGEISSHLIRTRCGMIAQWASGRAALIAKEDEPDLEMVAALQTVAGHASLLGELAESQGTSLSEPQLARLIEEALAEGVEATSHIEAEGGPIRVRSLAEINGPCDRLLWLGLGTADAAACRWSASHIRQLREAGIKIDDGSNALSALRAAEARGFSLVSDAFLAVLLPQDLDKRWHPIWLAIRGLLPPSDLEQPLVFEDLVERNEGNSLTPFTFVCNDTDIEPPQKLRPLWSIPAELLQDRETVSATELSDRLGCPLKWTLNYQAKLRPSSIAELPGDFQLKGTFCHSVLERVFGDGGELPDVDEAVSRVATVFNERLPLDAAPLAQPDKYAERQRLRGELENATRVLVGALKSGGYRIAGIEFELSGCAFDKSLTGWIDCLAQRDDGEEAIIDFKYGGRSKYYSLIEDGKAVQLATYAFGRSTEKGMFPAIAYLVLSDGLLYTPSASPIQGDNNRSVINGPAIQTVWQSFVDAIAAAEDWLTSDAAVPARPLQDAADWPVGTTIVLDSKLKPDSWQEVCKYCDYKRICGIQETS